MQKNYNINQNNLSNNKKLFPYIVNGKIIGYKCMECYKYVPTDRIVQNSPNEWICKDCLRKRIEFRKKLREKQKGNLKPNIQIDINRVMEYHKRTGGKMIADGEERSRLEEEVAVEERKLKK